MALTNYTIYKWLIYLLEKEADERHGMTLNDINQRYLWDREAIFGQDPRTGRVRTGLPEKKVVLVDAERKKRIEYQDPQITSKTFLNWRHSYTNNSVYLSSRLSSRMSFRTDTIWQVRNYWMRTEPLRATIDYLVDEETRGYETKTLLTVSPRGRKAKAKGVDAGDNMGFVSVGDNSDDYYEPQFGYHEEPEIVDTIKFLMAIGEALVIRKNSKNMVLEAQALKCINNRWYVLGNVYEYGDRETLKPVIYDVPDLRISEDEDVVGPLYKVVEDYDIYELIPDDWTCHFNLDKVVSLYLKTTGSFLDDTPFCSTQEKLDLNVGILHNLYKVYVKPNVDFYIQYMAYGDELRVVDLSDKVEATPTDISPDPIKYLKDLRKRGLCFCC